MFGDSLVVPGSPGFHGGEPGTMTSGAGAPVACEATACSTPPHINKWRNAPSDKGVAATRPAGHPSAAHIDRGACQGRRHPAQGVTETYNAVSSESSGVLRVKCKARRRPGKKAQARKKVTPPPVGGDDTLLSELLKPPTWRPRSPAASSKSNAKRGGGQAGKLKPACSQQARQGGQAAVIHGSDSSLSSSESGSSHGLLPWE